MNGKGILKITSSTNGGIGTGFVIERDEEGVVVATCSHVLSTCGVERVLVDGVEALVQEDFSSKGLDLAILYVKGLEQEPLQLAEQSSERVKIYGYTHFNTKLRANVKGEWMQNVEAKHHVSLTGEGETIEVIRLSSAHKISSGYSGSPVICEQRGVVVGMVALEVSGNSHDSYTNYALSAKHILENSNLPSPSPSQSVFVTKVFDTLTENRLVVLFSQDFTDITHNQNALKLKSQEKFKEGFYHFSVPPCLDDSKVYFGILAKSCGLRQSVDTLHDWKVAMHKKLSSGVSRVLLFITDMENGNIELDKQFSQIIRSLVSEFPNFLALFIGKKDLAFLVYGNGDLSPLNTAKELFFPDSTLKVDEALIERQFLTLGRYQSSICKYLKKETLGRHKTWSFNETINALFWKNLLVKKGKKFAWRDELTNTIGREVFECDEDEC